MGSGDGRTMGANASQLWELIVERALFVWLRVRRRSERPLAQDILVQRLIDAETSDSSDGSA